MNKAVFRIVVGVIIMALGLGVYIYIASERANPVPVVEYIYKRYNPDKKEFNDLTNEIGFDGIDSLGYDQLNNKEVRIKWGNMLFTLNEDDLNDKGLMTMINRMGMTVEKKTDEDTGKNTFIVKYKGEKIDLYDLEVGK